MASSRRPTAARSAMASLSPSLDLNREATAKAPPKPPAGHKIVGKSDPALRYSGQGHRRRGLRAGHAAARHAARPRGAAAALRLEARQRRRSGGQGDARRRRGRARRLLPRRRRRARGAGDQGARSLAQEREMDARAGTARPCAPLRGDQVAAEQGRHHRRQARHRAAECPHARGGLHQALHGACARSGRPARSPSSRTAR